MPGTEFQRTKTATRTTPSLMAVPILLQPALVIVAMS
jgi:hypothetical protein